MTLNKGWKQGARRIQQLSFLFQIHVIVWVTVRDWWPDCHYHPTRDCHTMMWSWFCQETVTGFKLQRPHRFQNKFLLWILQMRKQKESAELTSTLYWNRGPVGGTLSPVLFFLGHKTVLNLLLPTYRVKRIHPLTLFSDCYKYIMKRNKWKTLAKSRFSPFITEAIFNKSGFWSLDLDC